ncbi:BolA family transcriptional regulator [Thioclava sp. SK-1]|nr:BolA family transcriptional regulator [Thioclava sp. SK-1]
MPLSPELLDIIDESHLHAGHSAQARAGESHFRIRLKASSLADMGRVARHRKVHALIGADLIARIHALALDIDT